MADVPYRGSLVFFFTMRLIFGLIMVVIVMAVEVGFGCGSWLYLWLVWRL